MYSTLSKLTDDQLQVATVTVQLSWPDIALSPYSHLHWSRVNPIKRKNKSDAYDATLAAIELAGLDRDKITSRGRVGLVYLFWPPDDTKRDLDNLLASCKAAQDGLALALNVDDATFGPITVDWGDRWPGAEPGQPGTVTVFLIISGVAI